MKILIIGDVHSHYSALKRVIKKYKDVNYIFQVGDLGLYFTEKAAKEDKMAYIHHPKLINSFLKKYKENKVKPLDKPVYFIKGNHEDYDYLDSEELQKLNIFYIKQGEIKEFEGLKILGMGGIYSPVTSLLSSNSLMGRSRRFYTKEELASINREDIDILLLHNAPTQSLPNYQNKEEGYSDLSELIIKVNPKLTVHGHHHINYWNKQKAIYGLGNFGKNHNSYIVISIENKEIKSIMPGGLEC